MKIGLIQNKSKGSQENNILSTLKSIDSLSNKGVEVICLQELFLTDYFCFEENPNHFDLANDFKNSEIIEKLRLSSEENKIVLLASCFEKRATGLYHNTVIVFDQGEQTGIYRKQHIPDDPGYYEKYYFTPGDGGYKVFNTSKGKIGTLICWDQWYPEAARLTSLKGAEIIFYPTAIGWDLDDSEKIKEEELEAWKTMHKAHAIANGIPIVAVNRVGEENGVKFWGSSLVVNAFGTILKEGDVDKEEEIQVDLNREDSEFYRRRWPFLRDRRIDTYQSLDKRIDDE